jgi:hypothetical protein
MSSITSLNLKPVQEIYALLADERKSLAALAPHNGTAPGARAVSACRHWIDTYEAELARRAAINSDEQEDL